MIDMKSYKYREHLWQYINRYWLYIVLSNITHCGVNYWKLTFVVILWLQLIVLVSCNGKQTSPLPPLTVVYYLNNFVARCNPVCMLVYLKEFVAVPFISWSILHPSMVRKILYWHIQSFYWSYISPIYQRYARKSITSTKMLPMWAIQFMKCNLLRQA